MAYGTAERMWTLSEYIKKYDQLEAENKRLIELLWKMRQEHIENRRSSYGKVWNYIDAAIGKKRLKQALEGA